MNDEHDTYYRSLALHYGNEAKLSGCLAAVHLEADDDKIFWSKVFEHYLPQYAFNYVTYSRTPKGTLGTGCTMCLKYFELGCLSGNFLICIDSDYRWLLQEPDMDAEHFIFQTYTHSIENHYCYFENLERVFRKYEYDRFGAYAFLKDYSEALYDLFICHLISIVKDDGLFDKKEFKSFINLEIKYLDEKQIISGLRNRIRDKLKAMKSVYSEAEIENRKSASAKLGLTGSNAYLYFRGHDIFDHVIGKILKQLERESGQRNIHIGANICFDQYPEINKIKADMKRYEQLLQKQDYAILPV